MIAGWVALGASIREISSYMNVRPGLIRQCYARELDTGIFACNMKVGMTAYGMATSGEDSTMTKFWLQSRMKWSDKQSADKDDDGILNIHIHM